MFSAIDASAAQRLAQGAAPQFDTTLHPGARCVCAEGVAWSVYEYRSGSLGASLIFESERIVRRVRNYAANWERLSDEELTALSWSR